MILMEFIVKLFMEKLLLFDEGQSLSFVYNKSGKNVTIKSYPNGSML